MFILRQYLRSTELPARHLHLDGEHHVSFFLQGYSSSLHLLKGVPTIHPTHPPGHSFPLESALVPHSPQPVSGATPDLSEPAPALPCAALWGFPLQTLPRLLPTSFQPSFPVGGPTPEGEVSSSYFFPFSLLEALAILLRLQPHLGSPSVRLLGRATRFRFWTEEFIRPNLPGCLLGPVFENCLD